MITLEKNAGRKLRMQTMLLSVIMTAAVVCFLCLINVPAFETNDDNYLASIIYGARKVASSNTIYINSLLSGALSILHDWVPAVPWYTVFQIAVLFSSFISIGYVVLSRDIPYKKLKFGIFLIAFVYECFVKMQYTKTAALSTIAGLILLSFSILAEDKRPLGAISGWLLCLCGFLLRKESFLLSSLIMAPFLIHHLIKFLPKLPKKRMILIFSFCALLCAACAALYIVDQARYTPQPWKDYLRFNSLRTNLTDYGFPDYNENIPTYHALDITLNDYFLYQSWNYADPEQFTIETMQRLIDAKETALHGALTVNEFFSTMLAATQSADIFPALLLLLGLLLIETRQKKQLTVPCLTVCIIILLQLFLFVKGRAFLNRVDFTFYCALCMLFILYTKKTRRAEAFRSYKPMIAAASVLCIGLNLSIQTKDVYAYKKDTSQDFYSIIRQDGENTYIIEDVTQDRLWTSAYRLFDVPEKGILANSFVLGGWLYPSPMSLPSDAQFDSFNPYANLIDSASEYLVADFNADLIIQHIRDHYNPYAYAYLAKVICGHEVYRIVTHQPRISMSGIIKDSPDVQSNLTIANDNGICFLEGTVRLADADTYNQKVYIEVHDNKTNLSEWFYATQYSYQDKDTNYAHDYIKSTLYNIQYGDLYKYTINVYLSADGSMYSFTLWNAK